MRRTLLPALVMLLTPLTACGVSQTPATEMTLQGTVYAPAGKDVAGTVVVACYALGKACDEARSKVFDITASGASASFKLEGLDASVYDLFAFEDTDGNGALELGDYYGEADSPVEPPQSGLELYMAVLSADPGGPVEPGEPGEPTSTARFFLIDQDNVRNTTNPNIETDPQGTVHLVYPAYAVGDAFYLSCPANCDTLEKAAVVKLPTEGTVDNALIALDADGKPHILLSTYLRV